MLLDGFQSVGGGVLTMIPDTTLTLNAVRISQRTCTGMSAQTFPAVAHPSFTEVAHCTLMVKKTITVKAFLFCFFN